MHSNPKVIELRRFGNLLRCGADLNRLDIGQEQTSEVHIAPDAGCTALGVFLHDVGERVHQAAVSSPRRLRNGAVTALINRP